MKNIFFGLILAFSVSIAQAQSNLQVDNIGAGGDVPDVNFGLTTRDPIRVEDQRNPVIEFWASPNNSSGNIVQQGYVDWFYNTQSAARTFRMISTGSSTTNIQIGTLRGNTGFLNTFSIQGGDYPSGSSVPSFVWSGPSSAQMFLYPSGDLCINGSVTCPSDLRLKKNILPLTSVLPSLLAINGYRYSWIDEDKRGSDTQIGLIAQEVQSVYPELVVENEQGQLSVKYDKMVPVLVAAINEQQAMIEELSTMVKTQQTQIDELSRGKRKRSRVKRK